MVGIDALWFDSYCNHVSGLYEQQDDEQVEHNLSGKFITNEEGKYAFYCLRPTPYPVSTFVTFNTPHLTVHRFPVTALPAGSWS